MQRKLPYTHTQQLVLVIKAEDGSDKFTRKHLTGVRYVPLTTKDKQLRPSYW